MPGAIRTWWYPGERSGYEFVYPMKQAQLLARGAGEPVLGMRTETKAAPGTPTPELARVSPAGEETAVAARSTPTAAPTGRSQEGEVAPSSIGMAEPSLQARASLPTTASATPSVGLAGLALLLGAALIRRWRLARE
jgi:hypothetical protein